MRSRRSGEGEVQLRRLLPVAVLVALAACGGRMAASDPGPMETGAADDELTAEDFHGTYDLYMGGASYEAGGEAAPLRAEWGPDEFVVRQNGNPTIRTSISIDPEAGEIRLWDETTNDLLCSSEGIYAYEDDGTTITLTLESDPCENRAASADGARLVRR